MKVKGGGKSIPGRRNCVVKTFVTRSKWGYLKDFKSQYVRRAESKVEIRERSAFRANDGPD